MQIRDVHLFFHREKLQLKEKRRKRHELFQEQKVCTGS
jgi:hypothetical protein